MATKKSNTKDAASATQSLDTEHKPKKKGNPNFYKGMPSVNPAGKPKGAINTFVLARAKAEAAKRKITPLEFLNALVEKNPEELKRLDIEIKDVTLSVRAQAAVQAAPYMHRKMPMAADNTGGGSMVMFGAEQLMEMSDEQLLQLEGIVKSVATRGIVAREGNAASLVDRDGDVQDVEPKGEEG